MASRKIEDLTPRMQVKINLLEKSLSESALTHFKRSCTYRSQEEQDALWMRGRYPLVVVNDIYASVGMARITEAENKRKVTWTRHSIHTNREAVDYYIEIDGKYCYDLKVDVDKDGIQDWLEFAVIAEGCGLESGFYWQRQDAPHVQWRD